MKVGVLLVEYEGRESLVFDGGTFKDLALGSSGDEEELGVGGERERSHVISKVEMRDHHTLQHVNNESETIVINRDKSSLVR